MKYTLFLTQHCNLACDYCYVGKKKNRMSASVAEGAIDFAFSNTPAEEVVDFGFFGGETLLELDLLKEITSKIESHRAFDAARVQMTVITNGTIFSTAIADYLEAHKIALGISCDGPPAVHDMFRRFKNGRGTSGRVEATIRKACERFSSVMVNAVYHPRTLRYLPHTVEYLSSLGVRHIYVNPDFSVSWSRDDLASLPEVYGRLADQYVRYYLAGDPHFISLIDGKVAVILRGGYHARERCRMGQGEFAFTPEGDIYPCERLVGNGDRTHCIGNVYEGTRKPLPACLVARGEPLNTECLDCTLKEHCMNWCGCSNYFSSGYYNRVSPFLCASEKAAIAAAFDAFQRLEQSSCALFFDHLGGIPLANSSLGKGT